MRLLIDTNILISTALFPDSVPAKAFTKAVSPPHDTVVCDYSLAVEIVLTPDREESAEGETVIRDVNDRPIFRAAVNAKVDAIITGDKDFLESGITKPKCLTAAEFLNGIIPTWPNLLTHGF